MYIRPTFPAGGLVCVSQACTHSIELASTHIGSGPGVAGLSGMHVNPFVPLRRVRILPSASIVTIVAAFPTFAGAADVALAINCSSVIAGLWGVAAVLAGPDFSLASAPAGSAAPAAPANSTAEAAAMTASPSRLRFRMVAPPFSVVSGSGPYIPRRKASTRPLELR